MAPDVNPEATEGQPPSLPTIDEFRAEARAWLSQRVPLRRQRATNWGEGSDRVPVFHNVSVEEERKVIDDLRAWKRQRFDAGYGPLSWPPEYGGRSLPPVYELAFSEEEAAFDVPPVHEAVGITTELIAPTIREWGTAEQRNRFLMPMLRTDELWCQLYSEPGAGSDLAAIRTRADFDGEQWTINGQKVWTSGAQHASWGYLIARSDPSLPKHRGLTAFLLPMDAPGVEVRPLRQMSGGSSFNEVFFTDVRLADTARLGERNGGWSVAMTTLGFERVAGSGEGGDLIGRFQAALGLSRHFGRDRDPVVRQQLAAVYMYGRLAELNSERARQAWSAGATPGPEGSISKLFHANGLASVTRLVSLLLGPRLAADTGEWGTFAWAEHVTGAPGNRIAGGTDEVQRTIIGERILGLAPEPKVDRDVPFQQAAAR